MASPLFVSCDITKIDPFTFNVLRNAEVLEVNQDILGKQAHPVIQDRDCLVLAKPMQDGSCAVGLFNLTSSWRRIGVRWKQLGLSGSQRVRDLWRQQDVGRRDDGLFTPVAPQGVMLIRVWPSG